MSIFNSLGSNYNLKYVLKSLFSNTNGASQKLKNFLEEKYQGKAILTYKGREALTLALKILNLPKESSVAINGFTCFAVYKAIEVAGYNPICLDLDEKESDLNFTSESFEKILKENKTIKVVVIQNTLGYPADIEKIVKICTEKNIILIEDLAHCVGAKYEQGEEAGRVGDLIVLSFSQDKAIDAVSGGALVIRNKQYSNSTMATKSDLVKQFHNVSNYQQLIDRLYPLLTYKIRALYDFGLGKPIHFILKNLNLLSKPMSEDLYDFYLLPNWYCGLALDQFNNLQKNLEHRKKIAQIYAENLDKKILQRRIINKITLSSNLRFPIFVENRNNLTKYLKRYKIFVSDIWYDDVSADCPNAVKISKTILNLPTHINATKENALKISEKINIWLKSQ